MRAPLSILIYQRVLAAPDPLFPESLHGRRFEQHLRLLTRWFRLMPLSRAVAHLADGTLPPRSACLTFDHGYAEHASVALPLLQRYGVPATFFVAASYLDGGCTWSDIVTEVVRNAPGERLNLARSGFASYDIGCPQRRRAVIEMLLAALRLLPPHERLARARSMARRVSPTMLSSDQLLALHRAGMEIGAHPLHHTALASLSNAAARAEIAEGRTRIEDILQAPVRLFAYPSGKPGQDFEPRHGLMLRAQGFAAAVGMGPGAARSGSDLFALPRIAPCEHAGGGAFLLRLAGNLFTRP
ncbi:polysaccharide deacetylase family protein [Massilia scottii]|uniref:polysaccharide deacetylase family protein n=1 Tax=Massilia scottii TaxID=3057166 RepID=UPI0027966126|nr:polysaccharide deacetylase family protein [Massilia sp. CCM 9029]MDQ1833515.1 polysaccharide deacetylase family protein [Massilia sp. CCM 9029]